MDEYEKILSKQRLNKYIREQDNGNLILAINRYKWNIEISRAFYPALNIIEVSLRNRTHKAISSYLNDEKWLENFSVHEQKFKLPFSREKVVKAMQELTLKKKPIEEPRLIAELNFGFWTSFYDNRYEQMWRSKNGLALVFPNMFRRNRTRSKLSKTLNRIRDLRNRIFHYEPIFHWHDLDKHYDRITECASWISPKAKTLILNCDNFKEVMAKKPSV
ncbi:MAG: Abi family protein [Bdellovibrionales bacterium]|nr:Abi family protein [Bdellovibrionales bacterium]MCB0414213.1 Abi family protein [Bdellovibrionales bacterium]